MIKLKRAYDAAAPGDGTRILVDRLWPRGAKRSALRLDAWLRELAPSDSLRRWFAHDPKKWAAFRRRYAAELDARERGLLALFSATSLPLIVVIAELGKATGRIRPENAAALVGAGILSVLIFPLIALSLRARELSDASRRDAAVNEERRR